jgi:hypothetical protein
MTAEYATEIVKQPDGPRAPMRSHRRLDTVIRVSDGVVCVVASENKTCCSRATRS